MVVQIPEPYVTSVDITGLGAGLTSADIDMNVQLTSGFKLKIYDIYARFTGTSIATPVEFDITTLLDSNPVPATPFDGRLLDEKLDKGISLTTGIEVMWNKRIFVRVTNNDAVNPLSCKITMLGEIVPEVEDDEQ